MRAWCYAEGALQLAFPQIASDNHVPDGATLVDDADLHIRAVEELLHDLNRDPDPDHARAGALLEHLAAHAESRIVAFAEFAATVNALYRRLVRRGGIAMLTGRGGRVAGGSMTRRELLAQFAPDANPRQHPARRVRMLITTDLLSEGVNLQQANVVVHADLPWSPARCDQRVGRVRRLASSHDEVFVYALRPPASADLLLRLEQRLRHKTSLAARAVGVGGTIMPRLFAEPVVEAPPSLHADAQLTALLQKWAGPLADSHGNTPIVAAARAGVPGLVAVVDWGDGPKIIGQRGRDIRAQIENVLGAVRTAGGDVWVNVGHTWSAERGEGVAVALQDRLKSELGM